MMTIEEMRKKLQRKQTALTPIEVVFVDAAQNLISLRDRLVERGQELKRGIDRANQILQKDNNFDDMCLNTCGELQLALPYDMLVAEFMTTRDHVKNLLPAVLASQAVV